jgi:hypothetical protein
MNRMLVVFALLIAGCAAQGMWIHPEKTQSQFETDRCECIKDGEQYAANISAHGNPIIVNDRAKKCMLTKGYKWQATPK